MMNVPALLLLGYPVSVVAAGMMGVPWRNTPRQELLIYLALWLPGVIGIWWLTR